jgi:hypothetical protein
MADLIGDGAAFMAAQMADFAARQVTYRRGGQSSVIRATVGRTVFRVESDGVWLRLESRDYIVPAADLAAFGDPQRGDQILETSSGVTVTREVIAPGGEPEWRWSGPGRDAYRIHTSTINESPAT